MDLAAVFAHLGYRGATDASSWERAEMTWLPDQGSMPSYDECLAAWPDVERIVNERAAAIEARLQAALSLTS